MKNVKRLVETFGRTAIVVSMQKLNYPVTKLARLTQLSSRTVSEVKHAPEHHMFVQDLDTHVFPYSDSVYERIQLEGDETSIRQARAILTSSLSREWGRDGELIARFARDVLGDIAYCGKSVYEIVRSTESGNTSLRRLPSSTITIFPLISVQLFRKHGRTGHPVYRFRLARTSRLFVFRPPKSLGGTRRMKRIIRGLRSIRMTVPKFVNLNEPGDAFSILNSEEYRRVQTEYLLSITNAYGWPARYLSQDLSNEYYFLLRQLMFRTSTASFHHDLVQRINHLFEIAGISCRLRTEAAPESDELNQLLRDLEAGRIDMARAYGATEL